MSSGRSAHRDISTADVYLQPHSDDICFSLGGFALARRRGVMLTVFPISGYEPRPPKAPPRPFEEVTRTRIAEDQSFADACGLEMRYLPIKCASLLGHGSRDLSWVDENQRRTEAPLMDALRLAASTAPPNARPWLFCPSGIGGHVDHVAVLQVICRNYNELRQRFRIGLYEDLHYASVADARRVGIERLLREFPERPFRRHVFPLDAGGAEKLRLIGLYRSQFLELPETLSDYSPAATFPRAPHEAVWTAEPRGPVDRGRDFV